MFKDKFLPLLLFIIIIAAIFAIVFFIADNNEVSEADNPLYTVKYEEIVNKASEEFNVPKEIIFAVIKTESNFVEKAKSKAGAVGLMQLMPDTYTWVAQRLSEKVSEEDIWNPETNIRYGTYFLSFLRERLSDDEAVYAAYNAGYTRVKGWLADSRYSEDGKRLHTIPYEETEEYVKRVAKARRIYIEKLKRLEEASEAN